MEPPLYCGLSVMEMWLCSAWLDSHSLKKFFSITAHSFIQDRYKVPLTLAPRRGPFGKEVRPLLTAREKWKALANSLEWVILEVDALFAVLANILTAASWQTPSQNYPVMLSWIPDPQLSDDKCFKPVSFGEICYVANGFPVIISCFFNFSQKLA